MTSYLQRRSLAPFTIIAYGGVFSVHRGFVVQVDSGRQFEVTGATKDLRHERPNNSFANGSSVYLTITHDDVSTLTATEVANVLSCQLSSSEVNSNTQTSVKIGEVSGTDVSQELNSDFYFNLHGTQ